MATRSLNESPRTADWGSLGRFHLEAGDTVHVVETLEGLLVTPFDQAFADAMAAYVRGAKRYQNALRELSR